MSATISFSHSGDFGKTSSFLKNLKMKRFLNSLDRYGKRGVDALSQATPVDTGLTAASWNYEIHKSSDMIEIVWTNSNLNDGVPVAVLIQMGHGTGTGGYVQGVDYINPAMKPIFDEIVDNIWKEVTSL